MYILYYLNENYQIQTLEVSSLDAPILMPENLIFTSLRKGINFIKEPHECIDFTHLERLIMSTEFFDMETIKLSDFRKQNTYLNPLCQVDEPVYFPFWGRVGVTDCKEGFKTVLAGSTDELFRSTEQNEIGTILYNFDKERIASKLVMDMDSAGGQLLTTNENGIVILVELSGVVPCV